QQLIMQLDESSEIKDPVLLKKCLVVLGLTILGFVFHQYVGLESCVVALSGASLLLLLAYGREDPEHALQAVEWTVIFFFVGLFILIGALEHLGVIGLLAEQVLELTGGEPVTAGMLILWSSAIASAFIDNIPFVATMIPLIKDMGMGDVNLLWWALSLGACLGGNGTIIGASANVVVVSMAEKRGYSITFGRFLKLAFPLMLLSIVISTGYLLLWYYFDELNMHYVTALSTLALSAVIWISTNLLEKKLAYKKA
ncbi:MAG: sodium:proton antiporter, partial [Clostridia bacterium]|nr:sodium:proton antiporter [Clostridia bacterium]